MIRIDLDEFTIDVPIEKRMSVEQFLAVADKLEVLAGRAHGTSHESIAEWQPTLTPSEKSRHLESAPVLPAHSHQTHSQNSAHPDDLRFDHEEAQRLEYFMERLAKQLAKLEETHIRLERIERSLLENGINPHKR